MTGVEVAAGITQLVRERDDLLRACRERDARIAELKATVARLDLEAKAGRPEVARLAYRRGYLTGRAAKRRGAPANPSPEYHARGFLRQLMLEPANGASA